MAGMLALIESIAGDTGAGGLIVSKDKELPEAGVVYKSLPLTRRDLIGTGLSLAALGISHTSVAANKASGAKHTVLQAPFKSLREYVSALDARGLVVRIPRADQDAYEATALWYRFHDQHGMNGAPTLIFDELLINGKWIRGPLIVNESGHPYAECLAFGLEPVDEGPFVKEPFASYRKARDHLEKVVAANDGRYPEISPVEVSSDSAPCREIISTGDDIDLYGFSVYSVQSRRCRSLYQYGHGIYLRPEVWHQLRYLPLPPAWSARDRCEYRARADRLQAFNGGQAERREDCPHINRIEWGPLLVDGQRQPHRKPQGWAGR